MTHVTPVKYTWRMARTAAERQMAYRRRKGIQAPPPLLPCGTTAAARRHRRNGEVVCDLCREADRLASQAYNRTQRNKKKAAAK